MGVFLTTRFYREKGDCSNSGPKLFLEPLTPGVAVGRGGVGGYSVKEDLGVFSSFWSGWENGLEEEQGTEGIKQQHKPE